MKMYLPPQTRSTALRLTAFFYVYLCEEVFSQIKIIQTRYRRRLADEHLRYCLHLRQSDYEPSFSKLSHDILLLLLLLLLLTAIDFSPRWQ